LPIVTIDGENARDFDDAVLVEPLGRGFRLTVADADVAHYVAAGSPLDLEARARGTSVYFPDRVVPMLPEELSNGICSLKPGEDRLVKAVRLELDRRGRPVATHFDDAVIRSAARLTYTEVRQALVDRDISVRGALGGLIDPLERAEALARLLMARRRERGSIDFDLPEAEVVLDLRGRPADIVRAERSIAHQMIEEFMLAANEAVARELGRWKLPFLHRVHERPAADSVAALARFLEGFGLRLRLDEGRPTPGAFQAVLEQVRGRPEERLVNTVLLRSMQQARYAAEPLGHFGLATDCYTHFTSPIRRYPDLIVHRLLDVALRGAGRVPPDLVAIAEESSRRERVAMEAEREIVQLKKIQFMQDKAGNVYDGFVSGVAPFGFFVELREVFVEGLVHVTTLGGDFYEHVEAQHLLRGRRTRRTYRVGDPVTVRVAGASVERRAIDFVVANGEVEEPWRRRRRRS
ncbi:MAG: VacB/RNase II family 3'-5' exoribonuclease, partial [Deltaproteobacteria bacterium]